MSEDKSTSAKATADKEEKKDIKKVDDKSVDVKVGKNAEKDVKKGSVETRHASSGKKDAAKEEEGIKNLEELPEDIVKKMEKRKTEVKKLKSKKKAIKKKKKASKRVSVGKAYIKSTYNNTIVTLTDIQGNVLSWASAGIAGFRGPKKSTPYAAQIITRIAVGKAREEYGLQEVSVFIRGVGTGRESAVRALNNNGLIVTSIKDITPIPHNGCRAKKPRRV